jgi:hypothetical protein
MNRLFAMSQNHLGGAQYPSFVNNPATGNEPVPWEEQRVLVRVQVA